jgi:hypothetical protein
MLRFCGPFFHYSQIFFKRGDVALNSMTMGKIIQSLVSHYRTSTFFFQLGKLCGIGDSFRWRAVPHEDPGKEGVPQSFRAADAPGHGNGLFAQSRGTLIPG